MLESLFQLAGPVQALCATLMTWALTSLGACVVFLLRKPNRNVMDAMLGLAGGVMVAASFWSLLSPCIDMAGELGMRPWSTALIGFMGGGFLLFWGDRAFTHFSQKREAAGKNGRSAGFKRCAMLVFSITLHNIPEGLAIGVAFGSLAYGLEGSTAVGAWMLAVGIGLQNLPEGMAPAPGGTLPQESLFLWAAEWHRGADRRRAGGDPGDAFAGLPALPAGLRRWCYDLCGRRRTHSGKSDQRKQGLDGPVYSGGLFPDDVLGRGLRIAGIVPHPHA